MRRSILIVLTVAAMSHWIARAERTPSVAAAAPLAWGSAADWVRTADGWERRGTLTAGPREAAVNLHPGLLAALQVGVSLLALVLFPGRAVPVRATAPAPATARRSARRPAAELSASR